MEHSPIAVHQGFVQLLAAYGNELDLVNDAKASYERESKALGPKEERLIHFLGTASPQHEAPFRGLVMKFRIKAPLMVARQWWKYVVASRHVDEQAGWNEASRRYVTDAVEFYVPQVWRSAPENRKQGSGGPIARHLADDASVLLLRRQATAQEDYRYAQEGLGICAEQARLFLPAYGLYISWHWTASLQAVAHFVNQRLEHSAQSEIREFALVVDTIASQQFPLAWKALRYDERAQLRAKIKELEAQLAAQEGIVL